jgi:cobalt/nickel transport system ATP-binding protein
LANLDPAKAEDRPKIPGKLGIVFQQSDDQLFCANVGDDVAFGPLNLGLPRAEVKERAAAALGQVGLTGQEERVPFHLSGGEKRRVAIAGILAMKPEVILFDEPSIYLDSKGRRELIELIGHLPGTKLIASHDLPFIARTCSRVIVLHAGKLVADAPTTILADQSFLQQHDLDSI